MTWNWLQCDICEKDGYDDDNPFVEVRQKRPSDPADMTCIMAGHWKCLGGMAGKEPSPSELGGVATPEQWQEWIEGPGESEGFLWLG